MRVIEADYPFLSGGGEMGALMRGHDWETTPFGAPATWPQSLRSIVSVCLNSPLLGAVLWGPDFRMLYNDVFIPSMADRHPLALGEPVAQVWGSAWTIIAEPYHRAMATGEGFAQNGVEVPMVRNGVPEITYWDIAVAPIRGEDGSVVGLLSQGVEITERVLADRARRASDERLQQALSAGGGIGTWDWDVPVDRVRSDARFARLYGVPVEIAAQGAPIEHFFRCIHPDDLPRVETAVAIALRTGRVFSEEYRLLDADGGIRWLVAQGQCELAEDGTPLRFPGVSFDITERKRLEEAISALNAELEQRVEDRTRELVQAQEALRQSQKMEAVGQLTGGIAHDFNNLLQGISGSLQIAQRRIAQGRTADVDRFFEGAIASTNRAAALTHRLLAFARRQPLDPRSIDAGTLILSLEDLFRRTIGETIALEIDQSPDLWRPLCDANQLESSLLNLVINARDAMPNGGRLIIRTANVRIDADHVGATPNLRVGDYVCVSVTDTGIGMSAETIDRAFEPFFTSKPIGQGTGLGLSMVYGFVGQSDGDVDIDSAIGRGTTITLRLPRALAVTDAASDQPTARAVPLGGNSETVLVIEDEDVVRGLIVEILQELGYAALEANDGQQGLAILASPRTIDLLITDIGLPGATGVEVAETARRLRPGLKILFMTGYADKAASSSGFLDDGMAMITKPIDMDALAVRIRAIIESR